MKIEAVQEPMPLRTDAHGIIRRRQMETFRSMSPERRLAEGMKMNRMMRELMGVGFKQRHPEWTDAEIHRAVAERILHARTG